MCPVFGSPPFTRHSSVRPVSGDSLAPRKRGGGSCAPNAMLRSGFPSKQGAPPALHPYTISCTISTPERRRGCCFEGRPECAAAFRRVHGALHGAPNERRMKGRIPETAPRHSDGWADSSRSARGRGSVTLYASASHLSPCLSAAGTSNTTEVHLPEKPAVGKIATHTITEEHIRKRKQQPNRPARQTERQ